MAPGISTEIASNSRAGARKPQAVAVPGVERELEASGMGAIVAEPSPAIGDGGPASARTV
jgi:hypothetical protein